MLLFFASLFGQTSTYTLTVFGTVKDLAGKPVPNATIVVNIPSLSSGGFTFIEKLQTGPEGGFELKIPVPNSTTSGVIYVILYDCNGKEVGQKAEFKLGNTNKFEFNFKYCGSAVDL
jgi:hypothetical protein